MASELIPMSVIVHTRNSAQTLKACLESAKFARDIVVIDMHSSDESKQIAKAYTNRIFEVEDSGIVETARNFGISKATENWIFLLDADEEISPDLRDWLQSFLRQKQIADVTAYFIPRQNIMFGKVVKGGWWPDYNLRFFQKGSVTWPEKIHSTPEFNGKREYLPIEKERYIIHHNYQSVSQFVDRMNHYTTVTANQLPKLESALHAGDLLRSFQDEFARRMFQWKGIEDGGIGVGLSLLQATYELLISMKRWEKNNFIEKKTAQEDLLMALEEHKNTLAYWIADWQVNHTTGMSNVIWRIRRKLRI
jgi:hypothetical protein